MSSRLRLPGAVRGLSAKLLALTILFVLLGEILIYVPSIARHRLVFLQERVAAARLAALTIETMPYGTVSDEIRADLAKLHVDLLTRAGVCQVSIRSESPERKIQIVHPDKPCALPGDGQGDGHSPSTGNETPDKTLPTFDLRDWTAISLLGDAAETLRQGGGRTIHVRGAAPGDPPGTSVDILLSETALFDSMLDYSWRIAVLSLILAIIVAGLVYLSLHRLMVRPLGRLTDSLVSFRDAPGNPNTTVRVSGRRDEIGLAEQELKDMQMKVRETFQKKNEALRTKKRLADIGRKIARIHHKLNNMMQAPLLRSEKLAAIPDSEVQEHAVPLHRDIEQVSKSCGRILADAKGDVPPPARVSFALAPLVDEVTEEIPGGGIVWRNEVPRTLTVTADRDQLDDIIFNLAQNAVQAQATRGEEGWVRVKAWRESDDTVVEIADGGPGVPDEVRAHLFEEFVRGGRKDGTGLGLSMTREYVQNHGGDIQLAENGPDGAVFRLRLPDAPAGGRRDGSGA